MAIDVGEQQYDRDTAVAHQVAVAQGHECPCSTAGEVRQELALRRVSLLDEFWADVHALAKLPVD
ncbi:hypothetical protein SARC_11786, partial [Sphaeroforma arctica JP610]